MQGITSFLNQGWLGTIVGVMGLLSGIYFYFKSNIGAKPVYQIKSIKLIGKDDRVFPKTVKIYYNDNEVERLSRSIVVFWNHGSKTINSENIVQADKLRIAVEESEKILSATILKRSREVNAVILDNAIYYNEVVLSFDFLDPRDGVVIEVLHTSKQNDPLILGTLKGVPKGMLNYGEITKKNKLTKREIYTNILYTICFVVFGTYCMYTNSPLSIFLYIVFFIIVISFVIYLWELIRRFPKNISADEFIDFD